MIDRLVSLGSVIVDLVLEVPHLPQRGGDVLAAQHRMTVGGAFNVMSAAARLGLPALYAGPHGTGPFGDLVRQALAREEVALALAPNPRLDTGWTVALIEPDGERTFVTATGADGIVDADSLRGIEYRRGDAVYVSGYDLVYPYAGAAIAEHVGALDPGLFVVLDPGPLFAEIEPRRLKAVLARVDMLSLNEKEHETLDSAALRPDATTILRAGPGGATILGGGPEAQTISAVTLERVVDTSGAGDVHVGATLAGLARGMSWAEAVLLANRAAAYGVSRPGPATGPTDAQLLDFSAGRW